MAAAAILGVAAVLLAGDEALRVSRRVAGTLHPPRMQVTGVPSLAPLVPVALRTVDGLTLRGWYVPSKNGAAVVLGHGHGGERGQLAFEAGALALRGFGVLLFDWRGHGESEGSETTWGWKEQRDLAAAIDYVVHRPDVDSTRIGALGFSMGANTVAVAAGRDHRLRAIVLEGAFTSLEDMIRHDEGKYGWYSEHFAVRALRRAGIPLDSVRPAAVLCRVSPRPVLIVNGAEDEDTPVATARKLFDAACEPKELLIVPRAGHNDYAAGGPALATKLGDFFVNALRPGAPR